LEDKINNLIIIKAILFFFCISGFIVSAEQRQAGINIYKWHDGKYYINNVLVYEQEKNEITPECENIEDSYPLAFFGKMITIMSEGSSMCKGVAHPTHFRSIHTYMAKEGRDNDIEMTLLDFFPKEQIMKALKSDSYLKTQYPDKGDIERHFNKNSLYTFAFHHMKGNQVAVRLFLRNDGSHDIYRKQIGFYLEVKGELLKLLKVASSNNLLMKGFETKN